MTFLPIVERELRLVARRKSTYRLRGWTAVIALGMTFFSFLFISLTAPGSSLGKPLFSVLTGYAFCLCLLAGVLLAADCLSAEKREGTLGLLLLTNLKGYDVVLGKFVGVALNAFYGLLALVPVTALPLLLGGVTGAEFWRTALALVNALFFSLSLSLCVSAFSSDAQRSLRNAFALLLLLAGALPALAEIALRARASPAWTCCAWLSPFCPLKYARDALYGSHTADFWISLIATQLLGWLCLLLASHTLPRRTEERTALNPSATVRGRLLRWGRGASAKRADLRARLLPLNPVLWLASRNPGLGLALWVVVLFWVGVVLVVSLQSRAAPFALLHPAKACGFVLKILVALQACRFFVEARRDGSLELLLCTPMRNWDIIKGQWLAIKRLFLWPVVAILLVSFIPFMAFFASQLTGRGEGPNWYATVVGSVGTVVTIAWFALGLVVDMVTVTWVGMWLALSMKKPALAPALTILFVLVIPSVAFCGLDLLVDLGFVLWSVTKLQQDFRWVLDRQQHFIPTRSISPPPLLPPGVPPVISLR